ncbi:MAG: hypothetical protein ACRC4M_02045 [Mycoplasma sp.]
MLNKKLKLFELVVGLNADQGEYNVIINIPENILSETKYLYNEELDYFYIEYINKEEKDIKDIEKYKKLLSEDYKNLFFTIKNDLRPFIWKENDSSANKQLEELYEEEMKLANQKMKYIKIFNDEEII